MLWSFTGLAEFSLSADKVGALYKGAKAVVNTVVRTRSIVWLLQTTKNPQEIVLI